jgi:hypothetical protein
MDRLGLLGESPGWLPFCVVAFCRAGLLDDALGFDSSHALALERASRQPPQHIWSSIASADISAPIALVKSSAMSRRCLIDRGRAMELA